MKENLEGRCAVLLDKFIYENHFGQRFDEDCVYLNYSDLRDYSWNYNTMNGRISGFFRSITGRKLPLVIVGKNGDEATEIKNRLFEIAEADVVANIPGKVYSGEYYTHGFITASAKSKYLINRRFCKIDLTLTSDDPAWYREKTQSFIPGVISSVQGGGTDYPYDYKFDFEASIAAQNLYSDSLISSAFRLRIFGVAENPSITIGGHIYSVNGSIGAGESLLIDSLRKTITLTKADGTKVNWLDKRNRDSYIFEEIPSGNNTVTWNETFGFDLTVIEKRSEPRWT
jgi:hypothetical protein